MGLLALKRKSWVLFFFNSVKSGLTRNAQVRFAVTLVRKLLVIRLEFLFSLFLAILTWVVTHWPYVSKARVR